MFKVGDRIVTKRVEGDLEEHRATGKIVNWLGTNDQLEEVWVVNWDGLLKNVSEIRESLIQLDSRIPWIKCGKSYEDLRDEMEAKGESLEGVQVELMEEHDTYHFPGGRSLVGSLMVSGDVSGEEYITVEHQIVIRYRRLLTAKQLEE